MIKKKFLIALTSGFLMMSVLAACSGGANYNEPEMSEEIEMDE